MSDSIYSKFKNEQISSRVQQVRIVVPLKSKKEVVVGRAMRWALNAGTLLFLDLGGGYFGWFSLHYPLRIRALFCRYALLRKKKFI